MMSAMERTCRWLSLDGYYLFGNFLLADSTVLLPRDFFWLSPHMVLCNHIGDGIWSLLCLNLLDSVGDLHFAWIHNAVRCLKAGSCPSEVSSPVELPGCYSHSGASCIMEPE